MQKKLLLVHHFPLSSVTGVTVMAAEMLALVPALSDDIDVHYEHYDGVDEPEALARRLDKRHADATCVVGINLHIEVGWDKSLALAGWCAGRGIPLFNNVQDYWPHHYESLRELADRQGARLLASSDFVAGQLRDNGFAADRLQMGAQLPKPGPTATSTRPIIAAVGRIVRRKRFPDVVRAFRLAGLDRTASLRLTLVPSQVFQSAQDDEQMNLVRAEMAAPGFDAEAVQLVAGPVVPPSYGDLAAYVCASDYEGFSMTPYEAAYCGCPPIVSDIPPHRHMAENLFAENAKDFIYPVGDCRALADILTDEVATGRRRHHLHARLDLVRHTVEDGFSVKVTARALADLVHAAAGPAR